MLIFYADADTQILLDTDRRQLLVEKALAGGWIETLDMTTRSDSHLSECLRDYTDYQFAVAALQDVPKHSLLWTLGHKGGDTHWKQA